MGPEYDGEGVLGGSDFITKIMLSFFFGISRRGLTEMYLRYSFSRVLSSRPVLGNDGFCFLMGCYMHRSADKKMNILAH